MARVRQATGLLEAGRWTERTCPGERPQTVPGKEALFALGVSALQRADRPLYLEFGVASGTSLNWWIENLSHPSARFVGFDSFQGLPHDWAAWHGEHTKGGFAQSAAPDIADERCSLMVGWFEETLPRFLVPDHDALFVTMDADLYSSTSLVLNVLDPHLTPGTLVYFDDFPMEERSALADYCSLKGRVWRPVAMDSHGFHWLFQVVT